MIILNENYSVDTSGEGVTLIFTEKRLKPEIIDKVKTGKDKEYIHKQEYFLLNVKQALNYFLQLELRDTTDVKSLLQKMEDVEKVIILSSKNIDNGKSL